MIDGARDVARARYIAEHPYFESAAQLLKERLGALLVAQGVAGAHVKVRAKDIASFVKKLRKYDEDCWERTTDKVGAQLVVHTLDEVRRLRASLEAGVDGLEHLETSDKSIYLGDPRQLRYTGVHLQVRLLDRTTSDGQPIECEIQLRTQAQDVWAYLEHSLIYKPTIAPTPEVHRRIARLSVLVEIFDEEVDAVLGQLGQDPRYASAVLLRHAERWFFTFVTVPGDSELSLEVLDQVRGSITEEEFRTYADALAAFVAERRTQIEAALAEYGSGSAYEHEFNYFLFSQPEALILWERIEHRPLALARTVEGTELAPAVHVLAEVWGSSLHGS